MFQIPFEYLEFAFEWFNLVRRVKISIRILKIGLEGQSLHSIASSAFRIVWIYIRKLLIPFDWF